MPNVTTKSKCAFPASPAAAPIGHIGATFSVGAVGSVCRLVSPYCRRIAPELQQLAAAFQHCNPAHGLETDIPLLKPVEVEGSHLPRQH
jgi:hypothetical protein